MEKKVEVNEIDAVTIVLTKKEIKKNFSSRVKVGNTKILKLHQPIVKGKPIMKSISSSREGNKMTRATTVVEEIFLTGPGFYEITTKTSVYSDLSSYKQAVEQSDITEAVKQIMADNENLSIEVATKLVKADMKESQEKEQLELANQKENQTSDFDKFLKKFPNINVDTIPKEVFINAKKDNLSLVEAYQDYKLNEKEKLIQIKSKEIDNKSKAPITGVSKDATQEITKKDDFLAGFDD